MPEARARTATREGTRVEGAPYPRAKARVLGQKKHRPVFTVPASEKPRPLRELPPAAQAGRADDAADAKVVFPDYAGSTTVTRGLTNAADMSGADSERNVVMMSLNWSCDVSDDGGGTWKRLDPTTIFPNGFAGGFCCDQVVIYVPHADLFVWLLQYRADAAGQGAFRVAVSTSQAVGNDPTAWTYWDFVAGDFGFPTADMDYPDLSYSNEFLYLSTDIFTGGRMVMRMSLKDLRGGGTVGYSYTQASDGATAWGAHLVQQTSDRGMWAGQIDNSTLRFFTWPDNSGTYSWNSVSVAAWPNSTLSSPGPDGNDWLTKLNSFPGNAVTGGVQLADGRVALAWTASNGQANGSGHDFRQAHVRYVEIDPNSHTTTREIPIWNDDYAFAYPSLGRAGDDVGITLGWGGPHDDSNCAMGFMGDFLVWFLDASTRTTNRFGDYLTTRPSQRGGGFSAFAYWLEADPVDATKVVYHPFFSRFRRP